MMPYIIIAIIAYLIGSINFSVIISKRVAGFDVREKGSGNAGTTNKNCWKSCCCNYISL